VWRLWEGEAPAEPLRLGVFGEVVVVFGWEAKKRGGAQRELRPPEVRQAEGQWYFEPRMDTNGHDWARMLGWVELRMGRN